MHAKKIMRQAVPEKTAVEGVVSQKKMLSYPDALQMMTDLVQPLEPIMTGLNEVLTKTLAEDVYAPIDLPLFDQSAMDGYALKFSGYMHSASFAIAGEAAAGRPFAGPVAAQSAVRIFTGAAIPKGMDTVVAQEKTMAGISRISILEQHLTRGANVRKRGSEIRKNDLALKSGTKLSPASVGFLASLGISQVLVYPSPRVSLVITGNEFREPQGNDSAGKIFESNGVTISAALRSSGCTQVKLFFSKDEPEQLTATIHKALECSDLLIMTGGVSVGKYDYVARAAEHAGVKKIWHKINIRPGKPVFFGTEKNKLVFGLPGNPAAALICYYAFVHPAIQLQMRKPTIRQQALLPLSSEFEKKNSCTQFLHAYSNGSTVSIGDAQQSYKLKGFSDANAVVILDEAREFVGRGEYVKVWLLPE